MKVFNSLSGKKEPIRQAQGKTLKLFVCGPTVYDYPHIGNARTFMAFDIIVRYLRSAGFKIFYLQNITDIDDKIIQRAKEEKTDWKTVAKHYEKVFLQNLKDLNITSVNKFARATDYIPEIIKQVKTLIKRGNAYEIPGDGWYFDLKTFANYGKLAHRTVSQANDGVSRIDTNNKKRNAGDFCLWKFSHANSAPPPKGSGNAKAPMLINGEPAWQSSLGWGRPGWHIEDTAISESFFGPQYDLHGGAIDLKFPHHEAEIAQQESASGKKPFVKLWMHTGFLEVNGQKMSKSLGNFITIGDMLKKYSADIFRMMVLSCHYRSPMDYNGVLAENAQKNLKEIQIFLVKLDLIKNSKNKESVNLKKTQKEFEEAMSDDFNTPKAIAAIFELMNEVNKKIWLLNKKQAGDIKKSLKKLLSSFGIKELEPKIPLKIASMAKKRELLRIDKQFAQSDALRKEIDKLGFTIEDTPAGPLVLRK